MHFLVYTVVSSKGEAIEQTTERMKKFYDDLEVDEYEAECFCGKMNRDNKIEDLVAKEMGKAIVEFKQEFKAMPSKIALDAEIKAVDGDNKMSAGEKDVKIIALEEEKTKIWHNLFYTPYLAIKKRLRDEIAVTPSKDCHYCGGKGVNMTTRNPQGHLDYYTIGGRYNGYVSQQKDMSLARGIFASRDQLDSNFNTVESVINWKLTPYAIVTPNNEWIERGEYEGGDEWEVRCLEELEKYSDMFVVGCDCHS